MYFVHSEKTKNLIEQVSAFMDQYVYPAERIFAEQHAAQADPWDIPPILDELKEKAKAQGLWNLFLPESELGAGLTNVEYAPLCEIMGRTWIGPRSKNSG